MTQGSAWQGIFFDLDGTLADTVDLILLSFRHTMETHLGEALPDSRFLATIGMPLPVQLGEFARNEEQRLAMLETYVAFQRTRHDDMVDAFPGALAVLSELRSRGTLLALVTSKGSAVAARTMNACGLQDCFDFVVCGDEVERGKPDPEPVLAALASLRLDDRAGDVLFVGDSPHDLTAGRAAGTRTAAVGWGPIERRVLEAQSPDFFLDRMEDVLHIAPPAPRG